MKQLQEANDFYCGQLGSVFWAGFAASLAAAADLFSWFSSFLPRFQLVLYGFSQLALFGFSAGFFGFHFFLQLCF